MPKTVEFPIEYGPLRLLCPECNDRLVPDNTYRYRQVFLRCPNVQCAEYETRYEWPTITLKVAEEE
jgi:RNase P subunit RPR2